ncbi:MAG: hypothetical protein IGS03_15990 [Candidatus Sericytochromatia bacterium]|nr:hypothetical protein [Candidatus Sericytochromatia bacterium]
MSTSQTCPACQYNNAPEALICAMCSEVLRRVAPAVSETAPASAAEAARPFADSDARSFEGRAESFAPPDVAYRPLAAYAGAEASAWAEDGPATLPRKKSWEEPIDAFKTRSSYYYLLVGLAWALFFSLPIYLIKTIGWFFSSVVHEMGHTLSAWYLGHFALPALRLDGHAATVHFDQSLWITLPVWAFLIAASVYFWKVKARLLMFSFGALALSYPLLAFTLLQELVFLMGGHGGEMIIATVFFWRALVPGKVLEEERTLYAALAWYLWFQNLILNGSLFLSAKSRAWYLSNGSFGLENDWVRLAQHFGWSLSFLAFVIFVICVVIPPLGLAWARYSWRTRLLHAGE